MGVHTCAECGNEFAGRKKKYCSKECADDVRRRTNRERWRKSNPGWDEEVNKECEQCGDDYSVPKRTAHQARFCSDGCRGLWYSREVRGNKPLEDYERAREKAKQERRHRLSKERYARCLERLATKSCTVCGEKFETDVLTQVICSNECRKRWKNSKKDTRLNKHNIVDKDITLDRLYRRDRGVCYMCGEECDFNDKEITNEGHFVVGPYYPSVDHVKPLAKGGKHSWNNVKLSHHLCNSFKSDNDITMDLKALV